MIVLALYSSAIQKIEHLLASQNRSIPNLTSVHVRYPRISQLVSTGNGGTWMLTKLTPVFEAYQELQYGYGEDLHIRQLTCLRG